jgi:pimeloyl-ACP methyl ester carboxylesterase
MNVYLLGGLGADTRVFHKLKWNDSINAQVVNYLDPFPNESLSQYVKRLLTTIDTTKPFALIGLSFGGWVVMEMLHYVQPQHIILISSNAGYSELPLHYKLASKLKLYKLLPVKASKKLNFITKYMMGVKQPDNITLLKLIFATSNSKFTHWAIGVLMQNRKDNTQPNIVRIHGTRDYILPLGKQPIDYKIKDGGHLIVLENAAQVSAILNNCIMFK